MAVPGAVLLPLAGHRVMHCVCAAQAHAHAVERPAAGVPCPLCMSQPATVGRHRGLAPVHLVSAAVEAGALALVGRSPVWLVPMVPLPS